MWLLRCGYALIFTRDGSGGAGLEAAAAGVAVDAAIDDVWLLQKLRRGQRRKQQNADTNQNRN